MTALSAGARGRCVASRVYMDAGSRGVARGQALRRWTLAALVSASLAITTSSYSWSRIGRWACKGTRWRAAVAGGACRRGSRDMATCLVYEQAAAAPFTSRASSRTTARYLSVGLDAVATEDRHVETKGPLPAVVSEVKRGPSRRRQAAGSECDDVRPPKVETIEELWRISSYFDLSKGNNTQFYRAARDFDSILDFMVTQVGVDEERAQKLHEVGAIYVLRERDKPRRSINLPDGAPVKAQELIRVHKPRRFPGCYVEYRDRIRYEDEDLLVVDKPPGCPCAMHVSNRVDCLDKVVSANLGVPPLIRLNRLDTVTTGLVTLAKTAHGASTFWAELRTNRIRKVYKALLTGPVPTGILEHYMPNKVMHRQSRHVGHPAPRVISTVAHSDWKLCQCNVRSCKPLQVPSVDPPRPNQVYYEVEVELITGRTHQLRAQFAAQGSPIVHDLMYMPLAGYLFNDLDDPRIFELYDLCTEPSSPTGVALQCSELEFLDHLVKAGEPWWRS